MIKELQKTLLASTALLFAPVAALAQDWDGWYGGLTVGYGSADAVHTFSNLAPTGDSSPSGGLLGGFIGYSKQVGSVVWGGEVDIEFSDVSGSFINPTGPTSQGVLDSNYQGSIRAVLGFPGQVGNKPALYYLTAGWALADADILGGPSVPVPPSGGYSGSFNGWTAGLGVDMRLWQEATLRIEYRYTDFGSETGSLAPTFPAVNMLVSMEQHAVRVGLRFDF